MHQVILKSINEKKLNKSMYHYNRFQKKQGGHLTWNHRKFLNLILFEKLKLLSKIIKKTSKFKKLCNNFELDKKYTKT